MSWNGSGWYQTPGSGVPYTGATADLDLGVHGLIAHAIRGDASDGLLVEANNGTDVGILGPANTANVTWYGTHTMPVIILDNTGLKVKDTNASHNLIIKPGSDLTAERTLTLTTGDANVTVDLSYLSNTVKIKTTLWPHGAETTRATTLNGETYYFVIKALETATWSGITLDVSSVGADPANLKAAVYNVAGDKIAAEQAAVAVSAIGGVDVPWAPVAVTKGTIYVVGVEGDTSNSNFRASSASDNNTSTNRTGASTLGATVPTGTATAVRLVGNIY